MNHRSRPLAAVALLTALLLTACSGAGTLRPGYESYQAANFTVDLPRDWYDEGEIDITWMSTNHLPETGVVNGPDDVVFHTIWASADSEQTALEWTEEQEPATEEAADSYERVSLEGRDRTNWFGADSSTALLEFETVLEQEEPSWARVSTDTPHRFVLQKIVKVEDESLVYGARVSLPSTAPEEQRRTAATIVDSFSARIVDVSNV
jgi:hypothetical protein